MCYPKVKFGSNQVMSMATSRRKLHLSEADIEQVIAKHDELLKDWRAHREKQDAESQDNQQNEGGDNESAAASC
jgi:hypothetical protein